MNASEAERLLAPRPEFAWLVGDGKQWYTTGEVAKGSGLSGSKVRALCEQGAIPGVINYGPEVGWKLPRSGLVAYFAGLIRDTSAQQAG